jgi:AcrR family transcriptional regulator
MDTQISLHRLRKARIKLGILSTTLELIGAGTYEELHVERICRLAEVSRVTFFKYFPKKEDVLLYFMRLWSLDRAMDQLDSPEEGEAAIYRLFQKAADYQDRPGIFLNIVGFIARLSAAPSVREISEIERRLRYPEDPRAWDIVIPSLGSMLETHVDEAISRGELKVKAGSKEIVAALQTIFYGTPLVVHMSGAADLAAFYRTHLNLLFGSKER